MVSKFSNPQALRTFTLQQAYQKPVSAAAPLQPFPLSRQGLVGVVGRLLLRHGPEFVHTTPPLVRTAAIWLTLARIVP
jgi:hypothetical protein